MCWRCETSVVSRYLRQWFYRVRAYAAEMWEEADRGAYPPNIGSMLKDWLGRTEGAELRFALERSDVSISTFTTKPELSYGATYIALAPEHPAATSTVSQGLRRGELRPPQPGGPP